MGAILFLTAWLIPNHYPPWVGFHNEAAMFAALMLFCGVAVFGSIAVKLPRATVAIFSMLIALIWLQWASGLIFFSGDALVSSIYLLAICWAWWLGARTALVSGEFERVLNLAAALMVIAACTSSFMAILQWLNLEQDIALFVAEHGTNRPYANLAQPNLLATLLVMAQVFAYILYVHRRLKTWHLFSISCLLSVGVIATESRAGLLSAFFVGGFLILGTRPAWRIGGFRVVAIWWAMLAVLWSIWRTLTEFLALQPPREGGGDRRGVRDRGIWVDGIRLSGAAAVDRAGVEQITAVLSVEVERAGAVERERVGVGGRPVNDRVVFRGEIDPIPCARAVIEQGVADRAAGSSGRSADLGGVMGDRSDGDRAGRHDDRGDRRGIRRDAPGRRALLHRRLRLSRVECQHIGAPLIVSEGRADHNRVLVDGVGVNADWVAAGL